MRLINAFCLFLFSFYLLPSASSQSIKLEWAKNFGGTGWDEGSSMAVGVLGNVYTTGYFADTADFDPGADTFNLICTSVREVYISNLDSSGNFVWARQLKGTARGEGTSIAVDDIGNVYVTGNFEDTVDFDPGVDTFNLISAGDWDFFILKLDASGDFVWAHTLGGTCIFCDDKSYSISVDGSGNVYTSGHFVGPIDFDPGVDTFLLTTAGDFILKLDPGGNFIWVKQMGDFSYALVVDNAGNTYTTGAFASMNDFDPGIGVFNLTAPGNYDVYVSKLNSAGNFVWAKRMGGLYRAIGKGIAVDDEGNVYTTGYFENTGDFDPGTGTFNLTSMGARDIFVSKLDAGGNFVWAKQLGGLSNEDGRSIAVDAAGSVYTTGGYRSFADFDPGVDTFYLPTVGWNDIFISKLNASGNFVWAKGFGGACCDDYGNSIKVDGLNNIYTAGYFFNTTDFYPGAGVFELTPQGGKDAFVLKVSPCALTFSNVTVTVCNSYNWQGNTYTASGTYTSSLLNSTGCDSVLTLFLTINICPLPGTVSMEQKISDTQGLFTGILDNDDRLGNSVSSIGDLDGDGILDIAVGAYLDDDGGANRGAVWIMFLDTNGTVKSHQKISDTEGNFNGILDNVDVFGQSIASLGDLDGDGITDIAVGAMYDDDGGTDHGAVWILFLNNNGTVKSHQKISDTQGSFTGNLGDQDLFGVSISSIGDLDGDNIVDIAVGALGDDDGGTDRGAVWILFLNSDGTVKAYQKISDTQGNFTGFLSNSDYFGNASSALGDLNGDGITDLAVGAYYDDDSSLDQGAVWILFLDSNGTVKSYQKISETQGNFGGSLSNSDNFGSSVASIGDVNGDNITDIGVGSFLDDDGGLDRGAGWILFLDTNGTVKSHQKISDTEGDFAGILDNSDYFGVSFSSIGDLNGDGDMDIAMGAFYDDDGGVERGALWILFLNGKLECSTFQTTLNTNICTNDSVYIQGAWQSNSGIFYDSALTNSGCDSVIMTILSVNATSTGTTLSEEICEGDSALIFGSYFTLAGMYYDSSLSVNGCDSISSASLTVLSIPNVNLGPDTTICTGCSITLDAGSGFAGYSWSTGASTQTVTINSGGTYSIELTDVNGCLGTDTIVINVGTGVSLVDEIPKINIFPNPNGGEFLLEIESVTDQNIQIVITNILGEVVFSRGLRLANGIHNQKIELGGNAKGIYMVKLITDRKTFSKKLVIE